MSSAFGFDIPGYEIQRQIGSGGMSTVFLANQRSLDRRVAIKVMRRHQGDENAEKRFLFEGRTLAKLPHRNIVAVYDIVQGDEISYIAMEYLGGGTLGERMADGAQLSEAIGVVVQIAGALQFAHESGIVHRDLKPANIMYRDDSTPVLTDFGIARQQDPAATRLTQTGMLVGTPTYMSPEQIHGQELDGRSDQYSLGVMFYEMLTGVVPFKADTTIALMMAHISHPVPPLPSELVHFQPVLDRMLAKDREQRYPDLRDFVRDLKSMITASDTLVMRLQFGTDQSTSEQLRGLGFSDSQIHSGPRSGPHQATPSKRVASVTDDAATKLQGAPGAAPARRPATRPVPARLAAAKAAKAARPRWLLPAGIAGALLVLSVVAWLFLQSRDSLDPPMRRMVNATLDSADRLIAEGKLVSPTGDNAYETVQDALAVARDLPEALERLQRIVAQLKTAARDAIGRGDFAVAEVRLQEAQLVAPDDAELVQLRNTLQTARLAAERETRVVELLRQAEAASNARRLSGEADSALAYLRQAVGVDPTHGEARQRLQRLAAQLLEPADKAIAAGQLDDAQRLLEALADELGSETEWQRLDKSLTEVRERRLQQQRIDALLFSARQHVAAGRLAEPAGDNAIATLLRLKEFDAENAEAATLFRQIGEQLIQRARAAERNNQASAALAFYEQALQAQPGNAEAVTARSALEQRLGERQAQISRGLAAAREAIAANRFLAPAGQNAREALDAVLALEPGNTEAQKLRGELPRLLGEAAEALAKDGRTAAAAALAQEGAQAYPAQRQLVQLAKRLQGELGAQQAQSQREQRLSELRRLIASDITGTSQAAKVGELLAALLKADSNDSEARSLRDGYLRNLGLAGAAATDGNALAEVESAHAQLEAALGKSAELVALRRQLDGAAKRLADAEQARLAAISGSLLLDAHPWAMVEQVVDAAGKPVADLPAERSTPLRLNLPAGSYRVSFRHPAVRDPIILLARVEAQTTQTTAASFKAIRATDYLRRAGWDAR